jgi:hypothetical protein
MNRTNYLAVLPLLVLAAWMFAQQPVPPPTPSPSGSTPPTFPPDTSAPKPTERADQQKAPRTLTSQEVKIQIVQKLLTAPGLSSKDIKAKVTDDKILLKGSVPSENQKALAERIAQSYAGKRHVHNRLVVSTGDFGTTNPENSKSPASPTAPDNRREPESKPQSEQNSESQPEPQR